MARFVLESFSFDIPDGWNTRLLTIAAPFEIPTKKGQYPTHLVFTQAGFLRGQDFAAWVDTQIGELTKGVKGFRKNERKPFTVDGIEGELLDFTNLSPEGQMIRQLAVFLPYGDRRGMMMTVSDLLGPSFDKLRPKILELFQSLKLQK